MKIIVWNIEKVTCEKARAFAPVIGDLIIQVAGDEPFVFFVLENKTLPGATSDAIGTRLFAAQLVQKHVAMGGASTTRENMILFAGNGASFSAPELFTGWHTAFDEQYKLIHADMVAETRNDVQRLAQRPTRASTQQQREARVGSVKAAKPHPASHFRNPVAIRVQADGQTASVLVVHAPGPSSGKEFGQPYAVTYAQSVMEAADEFTMVIGDHNLRRHMPYLGTFMDRGVLTGATTKGDEETRHTSSRLDRAYFKPGTPARVELFTDGPGRDLTDHHCLVITLEQRAQRVIPDYFSYEPSPIRRQAMGRINRMAAKAFRERHPHLNTRAERVAQNDARRHADRARLFQRNRNQTDV